MRPRGVELIERAAHALRELTMLAEGPVTDFDAKPRGGKPESDAPPRLGTLVDHYEARLARWCTEVEAAIRKERKGQADGNGQLPALSAQQEEYWLIEGCRGLDYREAAERTGLDPTVVWRRRLAAGVDPRKGLERAAS